MDIAIIVHGGAGAWELTAEQLVEAEEACVQAALTGQTILLESGSALDAVEAAVRVLEDSPVLEAGRGSQMNARGEVEMDALIMDGRDLSIGAVAAVQHVRNPISLARRVMSETDHNLLVGKGIDLFADTIGFPRCTMEELLTNHTAARPLAARETAVTEGGIDNEKVSFSDTVGAVAIDMRGDVAAATSTGGTKHKLPGRVGDVPLVGSGGYSDNLTAAVSATGHGESLMKVVISKQVCDLVAQGLTASAACEAAIRILENRVDGEGGVIAIDASGRVGKAFNTEAMPFAWTIGSQPIARGH